MKHRKRSADRGGRQSNHYIRMEQNGKEMWASMTFIRTRQTNPHTEPQISQRSTFFEFPRNGTHELIIICSKNWDLNNCAVAKPGVPLEAKEWFQTSEELFYCWVMGWLASGELWVSFLHHWCLGKDEWMDGWMNGSWGTSHSFIHAGWHGEILLVVWQRQRFLVVHNCS